MKLTPTEIGDNLDLEEEAKYPCSDGSTTWTISVDKLLEAQLAKVQKATIPKRERRTPVIIPARGDGLIGDKVKAKQDVCPECSWKEGYFVNNKGEICPTCKGTGKKQDPLGEEIEKIVAHQFDLVTNLTQEAYLDSIKMIADLILAKHHEEIEEIFTKIDKLIYYRPDAPYKTTIEWDEYQALKLKYPF